MSWLKPTNRFWLFYMCGICSGCAAPGKTPAEGVLAHMCCREFQWRTVSSPSQLTVCAFLFFSPLQAHSHTQRGLRDSGNLGFAVTIILQSDFSFEIPPSNSAHVSWWWSSSFNTDSSPVYSPNRWVGQLFFFFFSFCRVVNDRWSR